MSPEISVYTNILLVEALETFTSNLGMRSFNSVCSKFVVLKSYVLMDVTSPLEFASEAKSDTSSEF